MKRLLFVSAASFVLCHCESLVPGRVDGIDTNPFQLLEAQATAENRDINRLRVPMLSSPSLEKRWGKPKILVGPKGGYGLRYGDPGNESSSLTVFGSPTLYQTAGKTPPPYTDLEFDRRANTLDPKDVSQQWQHARVAGSDVRFCISEANSAGSVWQYSTETFRMTAPDGRTASYRIRISSVNGNSSAAVIRALESLQFD